MAAPSTLDDGVPPPHVIPLANALDPALHPSHEMSDLHATAVPEVAGPGSSIPTAEDEALEEKSREHMMGSDTLSAKPATNDNPLSASPPQPSTSPGAAPPRKESTAILPADSPLAASTTASAGPTCVITLLLGSGARHPYKIDEKYLTKRNITIPKTTAEGHKDPFSISVFTLKELILREWREEWETKPGSPGAIRLIHFGRLLDDGTMLRGEFRSFLAWTRHSTCQDGRDGTLSSGICVTWLTCDA